MRHHNCNFHDRCCMFLTFHYRKVVEPMLLRIADQERYASRSDTGGHLQDHSPSRGDWMLDR